MRLALFIDYQNVYHRARAAFHAPDAHSSNGQIDPWALAELICDRAPRAELRTIVAVRVYTGRPAQDRDPRGYAASRRQAAAWEQRGIIVVPRTLRYSPALPPREKGIDVSLAIDYVAGAVDGAFDIGVIFSADTDLVPALEFICQRPALGVTPEVAAWDAPGANRPLRVSGHSVWVHRLRESDYGRVRDRRVYVT